MAVDIKANVQPQGKPERSTLVPPPWLTELFCLRSLLPGLLQISVLLSDFSLCFTVSKISTGPNLYFLVLRILAGICRRHKDHQRVNIVEEGLLI